MLPLTNEDKKARSLCGLSIPVNGVDIYPITIKDVLLVGEDLYQYYLAIVVMFKKILVNRTNLTNEEVMDVKDLDLILYVSANYDSLKKEIEEAITFFLSLNCFAEINLGEAKISIYSVDNKEKAIGEFDVSSYEDFISAIKHQNYLNKDEEEDEKPADEATRKLLEQRQQTRKMVAKAKGDEGELLSLADYISIVNGKTQKVDSNFLNVTVYSFYNYLERLMLIENYESAFRQILAGADPKKIKFKNWATKI